MKVVIVLAMHGAPPSDFPKHEVLELFGLHARLEHNAGPDRKAMESRYAKLDAKMRTWPRSPENDRFWAASHELAAHLGRATGYDVIVGFNEFCAPDLDEALQQAVVLGAERVVVITPMMTPGGEHAAVDIPDAIRRVQERHAEVTFSYAWPFETSQVAQFLADQIRRSSHSSP